MHKTLFILTQMPAVSWYRNVSFIPYMKQTQAMCWPEYKPNKIPNWQEAIESNLRIIYDLEKLAAKADIIVCQRIRTALAFSTLMALKYKHRKKIYCEIDDDAFNVDSSNPGFSTVNPGADAEYWFRKQLEEADGVIVSTAPLKKLYLTLNKNIHVVKNCIDFDVWPQKARRNINKKIRIGWQGALHHFNDLEFLSKILPRLNKEYKNKLEFIFFGSEFEYLKIENSRFMPMVPIDKYPLAMSRLNLDITLAPLNDTLFNRGKSNLRVIEAGALKKAVVASANNKLPYANTIKDGVDGILCNKDKEWVDAIRLLIEDEEMRLMLGNSLHQKVERFYNVKHEAKVYEKILLEA